MDDLSINTKCFRPQKSYMCTYDSIYPCHHIRVWHYVLLLPPIQHLDCKVLRRLRHTYIFDIHTVMGFSKSISEQDSSKLLIDATMQQTQDGFLSPSFESISVLECNWCQYYLHDLILFSSFHTCTWYASGECWLI